MIFLVGGEVLFCIYICASFGKELIKVNISIWA